MHEYLRSIGFSEYQDNHDVDIFTKENIDSRYIFSSYSSSRASIIGQYKIPVAPSIFLSVVGEQKEENSFEREFYFPCVNGYDPLIVQECTIQRHSDKDTFAGIIEDNKMGISLIFYITNSNQYLSILKQKTHDDVKIFKVCLSALSLQGSIILPIEKKLLSKHFDEENSHNPTEDIEIFQKNPHENVLSVVDTSFMPCGIECDKYQIVGEILSVSTKINSFTDEVLYEMRINSMGYIFPLVINSIDLIGEPKPGRRFKGVIWLQGEIEFSEK